MGHRCTTRRLRRLSEKENTKMHIIYICAPLGGDIRENVKRVIIAISKLRVEYSRINPNKMPLILAPHLALQMVTFDFDGEDRKWGMECCMELLRWVDEVIVVGDLITPGMRQEIDGALMLRKVITRRKDL